MQALAIFWLGISTAFEIVVAICVAAAPKGQRFELALWGVFVAAVWPGLVAAVLFDALFMRLARRFRSR